MSAARAPRRSSRCSTSARATTPGHRRRRPVVDLARGGGRECTVVGGDRDPPPPSRSLPCRRAARQPTRVPVHALRGGARRRRARRRQRDASWRRARARHPTHRLRRRAHRRRPRGTARWPRPRRRDGRRRRRRRVAGPRGHRAGPRDRSRRGERRAAADLHVGLHGRAEGGPAVARPGLPGRERGLVVRSRRRPLLRDAAVPRQRAQRDRLPRAGDRRRDRAARAVLRVAVHARRARLRRHVLQHGGSRARRTCSPRRSPPPTATTG